MYPIIKLQKIKKFQTLSGKNLLKYAVVIPILKSGYPMDLFKYRLTFILIIKIVRKIVLQQTYNV